MCPARFHQTLHTSDRFCCVVPEAEYAEETQQEHGNAVQRTACRRRLGGGSTNIDRGANVTQTQQASVVTIRELLEAGVHFGHQTRRWNPKMKKYIFGERNGIYIIDVRATLEGIEKAYTYVRDLVADGGTVMFVSTKRQMIDAVRDAAESCGMPYVNFRWLGGMLTNFQTMKGRIDYLLELDDMEESGRLDEIPKKEALRLRRERVKLERFLGGMKHLTKVPDAVFILDTNKERIAVTEANKKGVTVVATIDTNCDPEEVQFAIPANDDAIRAGVLMCRILTDAVEEGAQLHERYGGSGKMRRYDIDAELARKQAEIDAREYEAQRANEEAEEAARLAREVRIAEAEAKRTAAAEDGEDGEGAGYVETEAKPETEAEADGDAEAEAKRAAAAEDVESEPKEADEQ